MGQSVQTLAEQKRSRSFILVLENTMLIIVLFTDEPLFEQRFNFSALSKVRKPLLPIIASFWGNANAK